MRRRPSAEKKPNTAAEKGRWVVGIHAVQEALRVRPQAVTQFLLRQDFVSSKPLKDLQELAKQKRVKETLRTAAQLDALYDGNQGVAACLNADPEFAWAELRQNERQIILILDGIEDPHNLGSMLRTAWLMGIRAIFIPEDRAVGLTASVCKVASGGAEHVPVLRFTSFSQPIQDLKDAGFWIYGLAEGGKTSLWSLNLPEKVAWIIGSESKGMRITTERLCDELVHLPQVASGSSYNASIAATIALTETLRQFRKPE